VTDIVLKYTEPLLREVVRAYFFRLLARQLGWSFLAALLVVFVAVVYLVAARDSTILLAFVMASVFAFVAVIFAAYVAHYRTTLGRFRKMTSGEASLTYDEQRLTLSSELGSSTLPWSAIEDVWQFPRFWLLLLSPGQFVTLPLDCLDAGTREFILSKTRRP
jgi:hypothetical protein